MKKGMDRYASYQRFQQKGYFKKHSPRSQGGQACKAGGSDSVLSSPESEEEEIAKQSYGKIVRLTEEIIFIGKEDESIRKEDIIETHQEGQQGIQISAEGRCGTQEKNHEIKNGEKKVKKKTKHEKHEAKESKAVEKKEDKKEKKTKK